MNKTQIKRLDLMISEARSGSDKRYQLYFLRDKNTIGEFLFSTPAVSFSLASLRNFGIRYVMVVKVSREENVEFYSELKKHATLLARFSPYKDKSREWRIDRLPLTAAPFRLDELLARGRNGQILEVYRLLS